VLAKQALYHLSHTSRPFGSSSFGDRGLTFGLGQPELQILLSTLPTIAGMTGMHHHTQPFLLSWLGVGGVSKTFTQADMEHDPPNFSLPSS
jgi:hypothetical protein